MAVRVERLPGQSLRRVMHFSPTARASRRAVRLAAAIGDSAGSLPTCGSLGSCPLVASMYDSYLPCPNGCAAARARSAKRDRSSDSTGQAPSRSLVRVQRYCGLRTRRRTPRSLMCAAAMSDFSATNKNASLRHRDTKQGSPHASAHCAGARC